MDKLAMILFTRIPVPGKVKTRLLPRLRGEDCAALQQAMTLDTAWTLSRLAGDLFVFYSDEGAAEQLTGLPEKARCCPQSGADLGQRMHHALETVLAMGYDGCLLLGADLPFLGEEEIRAAAERLEQHDVVLCPSPDGGYWLVGLHRPCPSLFQGKRYGGDSVLADALACCAGQGLRVGLGPVWADLDTPEDLDACFAQLETLPSSHNSRTAACLRHLQGRT